MALLLGGYFLLALSACTATRHFDLPEVQELQEDITRLVPEIDRTLVSYSCMGAVRVEVYTEYGAHYQNITEEDACRIVQRVRALFMEEDFQSAFLEAAGGPSRDAALKDRGHRNPADVEVLIRDTSRKREPGRYDYLLQAKFFIDEGPYYRGGVPVYDGFSTWWGYRCQVGREQKEALTMEDIIQLS